MTSKDGDQSSLAAVQVAVRIRPLSEKDRIQPRFANATNDDVLRVHENSVLVSPPHNKSFKFDHVFGPNTRQCDIFSTLGDKAIHKFMEGYNVTILAYGQTSSGKTYTMGTAQHNGKSDPEHSGIVPRGMALLFDLLHQNDITRPSSPAASLSSDGTTKGRLRPLSRISYNNSSLLQSLSPPQSSSSSLSSKYKYTVKVSFVEIYNEELIDLLNGAPPNERPPITIREDSKGQIYWTGVKEMTVNSTEDVLMFLQQGTQNRAIGATDMNAESSRSHAVFSVSLKQEKFVPTNHSSSSTPRAASPASPRVKPARPLSTVGLRNINEDNSNEDGEWVITTSKFHFVDLAGSERLKRTAAEGDRRKEGISINGGLLALGNVISALGDPSKRNTHIPYRDSKLTRLLQDSLGGSAMTLMIACVSPMEYNINETLNTLQYANRARNIKNKMEKNEAEEWMTTDNIELLRSMIMKLKNDMKQRDSTFTSSSSSSSPSSSQKGSNNNNQHQLMMIDSLPSTPTLNDTNSHIYQDDHHQQQQQLLIADLKRQNEELLAKATVTRDRNIMVENELKKIKSENNKRNSRFGTDFEHLVEPVIEEYETSIASLEMKLTISKTALKQSDYRIEELQELTDQQVISLDDLQNKLNTISETNQQQQQYILELEGKLSHSVKDAAHDEVLLTELKNRIMKFKETDDNAEQYILDLEKQLAIKEHEHLEYMKERELLQKKITNLELELSTLQQQQQQLSSLEIITGSRRRSSTYLDDQHQHQQMMMNGNIDVDLEARKKMFSRDPARRKSTLLQNTLASLENVQLEYAALKERYKHWSVKNDDNNINNKGNHLSHPYSSSSSLLHHFPENSTSTTSTSTIDIDPTNTNSSDLSSSSMTTDVTSVKRRCDHVLHQYQSQLQRIHGAIQRVNKLEISLSTNETLLEEDDHHKNSHRDYLITLAELKIQLQDRQQSLELVCKSFEQDMEENIKKLELQYSTVISSPPPISSSSLDSNHSSVSSSSSDDSLNSITWKEKQHTTTSTSTSTSTMNEEGIKKIIDNMEHRLSNALQDAELQRSKLYVLQTKLQKLEVTVQTRQQRKSSMSDDQDSIEQLLKKMDAMKMQLETRDANSTTIHEV